MCRSISSNYMPHYLSLWRKLRKCGSNSLSPSKALIQIVSQIKVSPCLVPPIIYSILEKWTMVSTPGTKNTWWRPFLDTTWTNFWDMGIVLIQSIAYASSKEFWTRLAFRRKRQTWGLKRCCIKTYSRKPTHFTMVLWTAVMLPTNILMKTIGKGFGLPGQRFENSLSINQSTRSGVTLEQPLESILPGLDFAFKCCCQPPSWAFWF